MSETIYAPPEADIEVADTTEPDFYVVAPRKFMLLSIFTLSFYLVYWFYRNWRNVKARTGENIWAPARGVFSIFFTHSLFQRVDEKLKELQAEFQWSPSTIATLFVVLIVFSRVVDRLANKSIGSPLTDLISIALIFVIPAILVKAQAAINTACEDPDGSSNATLTMANWVWLVLGGLFWLVIVIGLFFLFVQPELFLE